MNEIDIKSELEQFIGTSAYHKHLFPGKSPIALTDGCKYVRDVLNANWLFDALLSYQADPKLKKVNFQIWEFTQLRKDLSWLLTCKEDTHKKPIISQRIEFSDFPIDYIRIWVIGRVALLPTEY
jgi:hypothetical protein